MKLEALLTAAILGSGCWSGVTECTKETVGQYRVYDSHNLQRCERVTTDEGDSAYAFLKLKTPDGKCVDLINRNSDYKIVVCPDSGSSDNDSGFHGISQSEKRDHGSKGSSRDPGRGYSGPGSAY